MKYILTLARSTAILPIALSLRGSDHGRKVNEECSDITLLQSKVLQSPFTQCCSHSDCADGMRCKNLNYYLKCVPADHYVGYYDEVCNEDPVEDSSCGRPVETRKPDCVAFDDISEAVFNHTETKCHTNEDCDPGVDCLVFGDTFCLCDQEKHFTSVYPSICNIVDTSREGDDESTIDSTTSENENTEENSTSTLPCVNPLSLLSSNDKNKIAFEHVSSNCRSSRDCDEGVECRVFGDNVFTACDQYNDFEGDFPIICHHDAP